MKINKLNLQEMAATGFTHVAKITYSDLVATAATTQTLALYPQTGAANAATLIQRVAARVVTPFAGSTTLTVQVGDTGDTDRYLAASDAMAAAETGYGILPATGPDVLAGTLILGALFTGGANLTTLTAGEVHIYFAAVDLQALSRS